MRKGSVFKWGDEETRSFDNNRTQLLNSTVLTFLRYDVLFCLPVDTSCEGTGYMLYQVHPESEFPPQTSEKERSRVIQVGFKHSPHGRGATAQQSWSYWEYCMQSLIVLIMCAEGFSSLDVITKP